MRARMETMPVPVTEARARAWSQEPEPGDCSLIPGDQSTRARPGDLGGLYGTRTLPGLAKMFLPGSPGCFFFFFFQKRKEKKRTLGRDVLSVLKHVAEFDGVHSENTLHGTLTLLLRRPAHCGEGGCGRRGSGAPLLRAERARLLPRGEGTGLSDSHRHRAHRGWQGAHRPSHRGRLHELLRGSSKYTSKTCALLLPRKSHAAARLVGVCFTSMHFWPKKSARRIARTTARSRNWMGAVLIRESVLLKICATSSSGEKVKIANNQKGPCPPTRWAPIGKEPTSSPATAPPTGVPVPVPSVHRQSAHVFGRGEPPHFP